MGLIQLCLMAFFSLFLLSCSITSPPTLRIGFISWPGYEYLALAKQLGYYEDEGLKVKLFPFQTLADSRRAFEKGHIDIMAGTLIEFYEVREVASIDPVIFFVVDSSNGSDMLLAHKGIANVAALKGKKIGLEAGSVDVLTAANALASAQLSFKDVFLVRSAQPLIIKSLLAGDIDAAQTYPPFAMEALANPDIVNLFDTSQTPGVIIDILFTRRSTLTTREADLGKVARAFMRAVQYQKTNKEDAIARMAKLQDLSSVQFTDALSGLIIIDQQQQLAYFQEGKLLEILQSTHSSLTSINVIQRPVCGPECLTDVAIQ